VVAADASLNVTLQFVHGNAYARPVRLAHAVIASHQGRQRNTLGRTKRGVPSGAVFHGLHRLPAFVFVLERITMANELLPRFRVLAIGEPGELFLGDFARDPIG
jgi:hypothetical protein